MTKRASRSASLKGILILSGFMGKTLPHFERPTQSQRSRPG
jgi:hypothetical protein